MCLMFYKIMPTISRFNILHICYTEFSLLLTVQNKVALKLQMQFVACLLLLTQVWFDAYFAVVYQRSTTGIK